MVASQPSAKGFRPSVPEGRRIYAVGDIHGRTDLLGRLHRLIRADAGRRPDAANVVVYLGDYVDRGPDSAGVIEALIGDPLPGFERVHLMGNHEDLLARFLADSEIAEAWFMNGGAATLRSYGIAANPFQGPAESERQRLAFAATLPEPHRAFLNGLGTAHREGDYLFVHAGVRPGIPLDRQNPMDLIWIRHEFLFSDDDHGAVVVHGHSISPLPEVRPNRIGIDTGAFATDCLTALVLEGERRRFLHT